MIYSYGKEYYHNEIELIRIRERELKERIEREFLKRGISYYIRWEKRGFFAKLFSSDKKKQECIFCINSWDKDKALTILEEFETAITEDGELLLKKTHSSLPDIYVGNVKEHK
ncbi:MAG: hypothetical protein IJC59_05955 [Lachnospiraceae bacterium]|nr:hypothetical protein [Lachnospiraceae bacterium]